MTIETAYKVLSSTTVLRSRDGKTVVLAHGCFDVLHPGHIAHLNEAKVLGDILVVSVTKDEYVNKGPGKPVFPLRERLEQLAALGMVDYVVASPGPTAVGSILGLRPDVFVKGGDYQASSFNQQEAQAIGQVGGRLAFTSYLPVPKAELNATFHAYSDETWAWLEGFRRRHGADEILAALDAISLLNIMVVGEAIEDRYVFVNTLTKSPREHHLSVKRLNEASYKGGSWAIQRHLAGFAKHVLLEHQLEPIIKERFVEVHEKRKLFSVQQIPEQLTLRHRAILPEGFDVVIAMDYGHGLFTPELRQTLEEGAKFLAVNCQTNSANYGFNLATKWNRMDFLCMDRPEYNLAVANGFDVQRLKNLIVTDGARGCNFGMDVPSFVTRLVDRVGAGDALFALSAPLVAQGIDCEVVAFVGSCAAAMQCETMGNEKSIDPKVLRKFIRRLVC